MIIILYESNLSFGEKKKIYEKYYLFLLENNQYPPSTFYSTHASQGVYSYSAPTSQSSRESDQAKSVYLPSNRATITHQPGQYFFNMKINTNLIIKYLLFINL